MKLYQYSANDLPPQYQSDLPPNGFFIEPLFLKTKPKQAIPEKTKPR
jgi:hypothetical protein